MTQQVASTTGSELFDTLRAAEHRLSSTSATICLFFWANTTSSEWFGTLGVARRGEYRQRVEQTAKKSIGSGEISVSTAERPAALSIISGASGVSAASRAACQQNGEPILASSVEQRAKLNIVSKPNSERYLWLPTRPSLMRVCRHHE
jgi:hypothetical protein